MAKQLHPDYRLETLYNQIISLGPLAIAVWASWRHVADDPYLPTIKLCLIQSTLELVQLISRVSDELHKSEVSIVASSRIQEEYAQICVGDW